MFNWNAPKAKVTAAIQKYGMRVTIVDTDEKKQNTYGIWDTNTKADIAQNAAKLTGNQKQIYLAANIRKPPVPGDIIQQGQDEWYVVEVEAYKPTTVVLGYRVIVQ